jgi:hypothetical protein
MSGVFTYISFLAIYYILLVGLDLIGSFLEYRKSILIAAQDPSTIKFKVDFNSDLAMASLIYLVSYYSGLFDG